MSASFTMMPLMTIHEASRERSGGLRGGRHAADGIAGDGEEDLSTFFSLSKRVIRCSASISCVLAFWASKRIAMVCSGGLLHLCIDNPSGSDVGVTLFW